MAPSQSKAKTEKLWRDAWCGSPYTGVVALPDDETKDTMVIQCEDVKAEYGVDAEILDDGRHVGIGIGNRVAFGIVARGEDESPMAVNVYRIKKQTKKKEEAFDFSAWAEEEPETTKRPPPPRPVTLTKTMKGDLVGIVRNQSFTTGNFFVECEEVYDQFQCDVVVLLHDMPRGAGIGDAILFQIKPPRGDAFTCVHVIPGVRKATGELSEAVLARGFRDGRRCFNCGGPHLIRDCPERKGGKGGKGGKKGTNKGHGYKPETMRMIGIVKKKGQTGRHFILCQDISDVYGKDAQIPVEEIPEGLKIGDRISFDVDEPPEGHHAPPLARNVKRLSDTPGAGRKISEAQGDGEDEGDGVEELDDGDGEPEADDAYAEGGDEDAEVDGDDEAGEDAQEDAADEEDHLPEPSAKRPRISEEPGEAEPETLAGWKVSQERLFGHLKPLPAGWIRVRSKSTGKLYFYNTYSGESTTSEPS